MRALDRVRSGVGGALSVSDLAALARSGLVPMARPDRELASLLDLLRRGANVEVLLALHARIQPERSALISPDRCTSWVELRDRVERLGAAMQGLDVREGDTISVLAANGPATIEALLAGLRVGARVCMLNPNLPPERAGADVAGSAPRLLITDRPEVVPSGVATLSIPGGFERAIAGAPDGGPKVTRGAAGAVVLYTSGTTGRPKGAMRDLRRTASPTTLAGLLRVLPLRRSDTHLAIAPLHHTAGFGFAAVALALGNTLVLPGRFTPSRFCHAVRDHRVTTTVVVPTMLNRLNAWAPARRFDLSALRVVVCTGARLPSDDLDLARALLGEVVYDLYGSAEAGWVAAATPEDLRRRPGTMGRPFPHVAVKVVDGEGDEVPRGHLGEIRAGGTVAMRGYVEAGASQGASSRGDGAGGVSIHDVGFIDGDGYLHVIDRTDDVIITGGVNVFPSEVESTLREHPAVRDVAVFGVMDARWGRRVVAAVVPNDPRPAGEARASEADLRRWCKDRLPPAAVPKQVRFVRQLPRDQLGKVRRRALAGDWRR